MLFPLVFEALLLKGERSDPVDHGIEPLVVDVIRHLARLPVLNEDCVELALPVISSFFGPETRLEFCVSSGLFV